MKHFNFFRLTYFASLLLIGISTVSAQTLDSSKYKKLATQIGQKSSAQVEVIEFFWYGCGHCFALESSLATWQATTSGNVKFVKVPAVFSSRWEFHAKAFYTMEVLGVLDKASNAFFKRIHLDRKPMNNLPALTKFLTAYGLTTENTEQAFNSFGVDTKLRYARKVSRESVELGAPAEVPGFLIGGKYFTNSSMSGSANGLFEVIDQLITRVAKEQGTTSPPS